MSDQLRLIPCDDEDEDEPDTKGELSAHTPSVIALGDPIRQFRIGMLCPTCEGPLTDLGSLDGVDGVVARRQVGCIRCHSEHVITVTLRPAYPSEWSDTIKKREL